MAKKKTILPSHSPLGPSQNACGESIGDQRHLLRHWDAKVPFRTSPYSLPASAPQKLLSKSGRRINHLKPFVSFREQTFEKMNQQLNLCMECEYIDTGFVFAGLVQEERSHSTFLCGFTYKTK